MKKTLEELLKALEEEARKRLGKRGPDGKPDPDATVPEPDAGATVPEPDEGATVPEDKTAETMPETAGTVPEDTFIPGKGAPSEDSLVRGSLLLETYRVDSDAITGGMGSVWKVRHTGWDTDLAMKRPKAELFQSDAQRENFIRECEAWIGLGLHPNIVSCYYVREIAGVPAVFSEWMDGGSLEAKIRSGSLYGADQTKTQEKLLDIAIQFVRGLGYAHENGLIHQDVKPDNVLLTADGDVKVADFGLARAAAYAPEDISGAPGATKMTKAGGYTPAYCSPEQFEGRALTRRTDIYSWAVSVLELFLGERPWSNGTVVGYGPEAYFPQAKIPLPGALQELLKRCLAYEPDDRPHDLAAVEAELKKIYTAVTGREYPRPEPHAAADTPDSLNNRALSYIDLGKTEEAERLLEKATQTDGRFLYRWNYELLRWKTRQTGDKTFREALEAHRDGSRSCEDAMEALARVQGDSEKKPAYSYPYKTYRNYPPLVGEETTAERPGALGRLTATDPFRSESTDGRYRLSSCCKNAGRDPYDFGYVLTDTQTGTERLFINDFADHGNNIYGGQHPQYVKRDTVFFAGPASEYVVMEADVLWIFERDTGILIRSLPKVVDSDGDTAGYHVRGYTDDGAIEYYLERQEYTVHGLYPGLSADLAYSLARISSTGERLREEESTERYYREALRCLERDDIFGAYAALKHSLDSHLLTGHEPSLRLWSRLRAYFEPEALAAVIPTEDPPSPLPERDNAKQDAPFRPDASCRNGMDDGRTRLTLERDEEDEYDTCMDAYEYTFRYSLTATDVRTGCDYYRTGVIEVDCEDDWHVFSKDRYLGLQGESVLLYAKEKEEPRQIDMSDRNWQAEHDLRFALPGGAWLRNTKDGVDIGGFRFDDSFDGFRPLFNADVVACRNRNYRLVYLYKVPEDLGGK